jgi:cytochrome c551/c552
VLFGYTEKLVKSIAAAGGDLVQPFPLYRQPALTDAEQRAIAVAIVGSLPSYAATLRNLLERMT